MQHCHRKHFNLGESGRKKSHTIIILVVITAPHALLGVNLHYLKPDSSYMGIWRV